MSDLSTFFHMGGYAGYVWSAYGITFVILIVIVLWSARQLKTTKQRSLRRAKAHRKQRRYATARHEINQQ